MFLNTGEYTPISIDALVAGMKIDYDIYFQNGKQFVLLCRDVVLTDAIITKLQNIAVNCRNIYVPTNLHQQILKESNLIKVAQKKVTSFAEYENAKGAAESLLNIISQGHAVPSKVTNEIAETVKETINDVDISHIIQRINHVRKVDEYLHTHSVNVAYLNGLMGKWEGMPEEDIDKLVKIGILHDIGKLKVPPHILNKPAKLTDEEFEEIKYHPAHSYEMLKESGETDEKILLGVVQHHEKVNGKGYPRGLSAGDITPFARITSVSDVYDAMVTKRVYKEAHSPFEILAWFAEGRYSELDIGYVNKFLYCMMEELRHKYIMLSNGAVAKVIYINPDQYEFPVVELDNEIITTSPELHCVCMYDGDNS